MGPSASKGRWAGWWPWIGGMVAVVALGFVPMGWLEASPSVCLYRALLGVECPGCGMLRALASLMRGDLGAAVDYNAASLIVGPLLVAIGVSRLTEKG